MVVWYKSNEGYILRDIFNRFDYNEGYSSGYGYDQIVNSKGLLTGCLNLIIDKAPTIPKDKDKFPEITLVIIKPISGSNI